MRSCSVQQHQQRPTDHEPAVAEIVCLSNKLTTRQHPQPRRVRASHPKRQAQHPTPFVTLELLFSYTPVVISVPTHHLFLSNHPLDPSIATLWSITVSPTPRYLSTHFFISWLSNIFSSLILLSEQPVGTLISQRTRVKASHGFVRTEGQTRWALRRYWTGAGHT